MNIPEQLVTSRLVLKRPVEEYAQAIFDAYACDSETTKYLSWKPHTDVSQTVAYLHTVTRDWEESSAFAWSFFQKADNQLIGMIDLQIHGFQAESGYVLAKSSWGNGLMAEALSEIRKVAFSIPVVERLQLICDVDNPASARVMEKAGLEKEGVLRKFFRHPNISDRPRDCLCYSCVRDA